MIFRTIRRVSSDVDPESGPLAFGRPNGSKSIPNSEEVFNILPAVGAELPLQTEDVILRRSFGILAKAPYCLKKRFAQNRVSCVLDCGPQWRH